MLYADRAFVSINGARLLDVQSAELRQNHNAKAVKSMTPDGFDRGHVRGNPDIDINLVVAIENALASPKLENIDYANNDVQLTFVCGADQYVATGLFPKETGLSAPGVGEEVKKNFSLGALKVTDAVGNSVLFDLTL